MKVSINKDNIKQQLINKSYNSGRTTGLSLGQGIAGGTLGAIGGYLLDGDPVDLYKGAALGGSLGLGLGFTQGLHKYEKGVYDGNQKV